MSVKIDIFTIFSGHSDLASAIDQKADTVFRWKRRGRIPEAHWNDVITAAKLRGVALTAADLLSFNRPMKPKPENDKTRRVA